ncbi:MAG: hypothetical protein AAF499_18695, partial [Pseudomonadota bacterium]
MANAHNTFEIVAGGTINPASPHGLFDAADIARVESTFGYMGYGPTGDGLFGHLENKPGITKGCQLVLATDV